MVLLVWSRSCCLLAFIVFRFYQGCVILHSQILIDLTSQQSFFCADEWLSLNSGFLIYDGFKNKEDIGGSHWIIGFFGAEKVRYVLTSHFWQQQGDLFLSTSVFFSWSIEHPQITKKKHISLHHILYQELLTVKNLCNFIGHYMIYIANTIIWCSTGNQWNLDRFTSVCPFFSDWSLSLQLRYTILKYDIYKLYKYDIFTHIFVNESFMCICILYMHIWFVYDTRRYYVLVSRDNWVYP